MVNAEQNVANRPALDPSVMETLRECLPAVGPDSIAELTEVFLADATDRVGSLRDAVAIGDAARMRRAAHSLKGMCGAIGAIHMSALSSALEQSEIDQIDSARLGDLERELARVQVALLAA